MSDLIQNVRAVSIVSLLVVGAIIVAAIPLLAGTMVGAILPEWGELRSSVTPWSALHVIWMYPALHLAATVTGAVREAMSLSLNRRAVEAVELVAVWLLITAMLLVFFEHATGALTAAAVSLVLFIPFVKFLEKNASEDDSQTT